MAIYGDMLLHFPELIKDFTVYKSTPNVLAGITKIQVKRVLGIIQNVKSGKLEKEGDTSVDADIPTIWVFSDTLELYQIVQQDGDESLYRVQQQAPWLEEGNFSVYALQRLVGITDKQAKDTTTVITPDLYA